MAKTVSWNDFGNRGSNAQKGSKGGGQQRSQRTLRFVKIENNSSVILRPVDEAVEFDKYVYQDSKGKWNFGVCGDVKTCPLFLKYDKTPSTRYAINVIDRTDGLIKIYEGPLSVFKVFASYEEMAETPAGGENGADFKITKNVTSKDGKTYTKYEVHKESKTPFTTEEKALLNTNGEGIYNLERIFKVTPADKIEKKVLGADYEGGDEALPQDLKEETGRNTSGLFKQDQHGTQVAEEDIPF